MLTLVAMTMLAGSPVDIERTSPDFDRWNYGFNTDPGARGVGSTFSAYGSGYPFDDRDGEVLLGFITGTEIEVGYPAHAYSVLYCTVELSISSADIPYDPSTDLWGTYVPGGPSDGDVGRPTQLSGVDFRNGWTAWSFGEDGSFGDAMASGVRNCFPVDFDQFGELRDISNNLTDEFEPNYWSVGVAEGVQPGDLIPAYTTLRFEVDVDHPDVQCYLRNGFSEGLIEFMVTSLHPASEPGSGGDNNYPDWVMKENVLVDLGVAAAASVQMSVELNLPSGVSGDVTSDGQVDVEDLLATLEAFGRCPCCPADGNGSGIVDVDDLLTVIGGWGS
ncbi:MAG: hypothetical protein HOL13_04300 [Phycisphaerae bacterium]|nr:hypothetical protein [Phycisphaerae bacterium]MBT5656216.1 hypothetical protein [Phycisphaerae bacterium]MBT7351699.1 hypothetical protein [Phycisphaerae bacterium]